MDVTQFEGYAEALKTAAKYKNPRMCLLEDHQRWVDGSQYVGRVSWWDGDAPLWEREPCIVYPLVQIAASSSVDLVFGEGRFPKLTSGTEDEGDNSSANGGETPKSKPVKAGSPASAENSNQQIVDRFLRDYHRISKFKSHCREAFFAAQGVGTACAVLGVRDGRPFNDLIPAQWCTPELGIHGEVLSLTIQYTWLDHYKKPDGNWATRCMLFKRIIDQVADTTYQSAPADKDGRPVAMSPDPQQTFNHGLGFCPVVWYPFMKGSSACNVIDGKPIHSQVKDEIFAHDLALSQRHRGALFSEPQICEIGVNMDHNPTGSGRSARVPATLGGGDLTEQNQPTAYYGSEDEQPARKKGPGHVWRYPSELTKVEILSYPEGALKAQDDNAKDLRIKLQECLAVVLLDPEHLKIANELSGKALQALKQKQIDRCDQFRDDLVDGFLTPSIDMQIKITKKTRPKVPNISKALPLLEDEPNIRAVWGPYMKPDPTDQLALITMVKTAISKKPGDVPLITREMAVRKIAEIFGIENVQAIVDALEADDEQQKQEDQEAADQAAKAASQNPKVPGKSAQAKPAGLSSQ